MNTLAWINETTLVCENITACTKLAADCEKPEGFFVIDLPTTPSAHWEWDESTQDWVLVEEGIGNGGIGDEYTNNMLVTPKPAAPPSDQPVTSGMQTL